MRTIVVSIIKTVTGPGEGEDRLVMAWRGISIPAQMDDKTIWWSQSKDVVNWESTDGNVQSSTNFASATAPTIA
jgi:hypothetical protein